MLPKNAKNFLNKISVKIKITVITTTLIFILIASVSLLLYIKMINVLNRTSNDIVTDEMQNLSYLLKKNPNDIKALQQEVYDAPEINKNAIDYYYVRIINHANNFSIETQGMKNIIPPTSNTKKYRVWPNKIVQQMTLPNGHVFLVNESFVRLNNDKLYNPIWSIQIAMDISYEKKIGIEYRNFVITILIVAGLLSVLLGYFIIHSNMRQLSDLVILTQQITVSSLNQRINPADWPKEFRLLATAFNDMLVRIENSFTKLQQFTGDLSHEILTPLNNLVGETENALLYLNPSDECRQVFESNLEELHRLITTTKNILFIAQLDNQKLKIPKDNFKIEDEILKLSEYYSALAEEKNITITVDGTASIEANSIMFKRMLSNLFSNSLKYTQHNGKINIQVREISNQSIVIEFHDDGIGIAAEHLPHVFDRFYRVDVSRSQSPSGVGLGLAIVKAIVALHHGNISITSILNRGTTIILTFPKMTKL